MAASRKFLGTERFLAGSRSWHARRPRCLALANSIGGRTQEKRRQAAALQIAGEGSFHFTIGGKFVSFGDERNE
jgi:hypothetical protein